MAFTALDEKAEQVSIASLLKRLANPAGSDIQVSADEIASAFALIFEDRLSVIQTTALLTLLHSTRKDRESDVIAKCSHRMRDAASKIEEEALKKVVQARGKKEGLYRGGLCDIVGTGGDSHSTFNVSTTASIIASPLLMMAKHGNRSQTSLSGSADVLNAISPSPPKISAINAETIARVYEETNYAFLFAPNFHPGMMYANPVRRGLGIRTIFNLMGPLSNPLDWALEARVVGVAYKGLGPVYADALRLGGSKRALVVCGDEDLDEISCAGKTHCWRLSEYPNPAYQASSPIDNIAGSRDKEDHPPTLTRSDVFQIHPSDFGFPTHPLSNVYSKKMPTENAAKLMSILRNELPHDDPLLDFVLINVAALLVIAGVCEADTSNMGPGDDGKVILERGPGGERWKEGVRRARWAIESGEALRSFEKFIDITNRL